MSVPDASTGTRARAAFVALHVAVAIIFFIFSCLHWAHAERKWTFPVERIERNNQLAAAVLAVFAALAAAVFLSNRPALHSRRRSLLHTALAALYLACVVMLVATAPQILAFGSEMRARVIPDPPFAPFTFTTANRNILRHDRYDGGLGFPVFNFFSTSQIRQLAYFDESRAVLSATPGLVGNIVHDVGVLKAPDDTPLGSFNASATQFSVSCAAPSNVRASSTDLPLDADASHGPFSTIRVSSDVPGRGADVAYSTREPFGFVFTKGTHALNYRFHIGAGSQYIRFPRVFNASARPPSPDTTIHSVAYDRAAAHSGVDDDLSNTIFFYLFRYVREGDATDPESAVDVISDQNGQNGSQADVSAAEGSTFADRVALFKVQAVACTMVATTFSTTVAHADNVPDLSAAPAPPSAARNSSWAPYQPRPSSPGNVFERDWANIFTPRSAPQASIRFDNYSAVPGFVPLNTLESYVTSIITTSPQLAALESALENITALAYWGLMQEFGAIDFSNGPAPGQSVGVARACSESAREKEESQKDGCQSLVRAASVGQS
ncbi:hypothetical protein AURDEDRAFT_128286 [Auricularia subglabra TFB-10046 SS5]|nr:hypothetical protein AURDEDRAFT_128286 [Auricularia subglabra TFB-10046 SS5]